MPEPPEAAICDSCGKTNSAALGFCVYCGAPLPAAATAEQRSTQAGQPESAALKFLFIVLFFALLTGLAAFVLLRPALRQRQLDSAVNGYFEALRSGNYLKAYARLSGGSKKYCTAPRFAALQSATPAAARDITVFKRTDAGAVVKYRTETGEDAYTSFLSENGKWVKPYIPDLMANTEAAIAADQPEQALHLAKTARKLDPFNPATNALLCRAQFSAGLHKDAIETCTDALLKQEYPAGFSSSESATCLYYLGTSELKLGRSDDARNRFEKILSIPDISTPIACLARLAIPQTFDSSADRTGLLAMARETAEQCTGPQERGPAQRTLDILAGRATKEAIAFGRNYKETPSSFTLEEIWKEQKNNIARSAGHLTAPAEQWRAAPETPGVYKVTLALGAGKGSKGKVIPPKNIWTLSVDLWAGAIRMEQ
ncbi:MAG: hypothetical protein PHW69_00330 [Elusimicrobiaceae bacterium]|nr:hypothetical protein [Elusimicrobiaceae bacterium]